MRRASSAAFMSRMFGRLLTVALAVAAFGAGEVLALADRKSTPAPQPGLAREVDIENATAKVMEYLYLAPATDNEWGEDRLGDSTTLAAGATQKVTLGDGAICRYDLRATFEGGAEEMVYDVDLCAQPRFSFTGRPAPRVASPKPADDPSVRIVNLGDVEIRTLQASPAGQDHWGKDRLGNATVPQGETFHLVLPREKGCRWDLHITFNEGEPDERRDLDLCVLNEIATERVAGSGAPQPPSSRRPGAADSPEGARPGTDAGPQAGGGGPERRVTVLNRGTAEILSLFVSPTTDDNWGDDRLGSDTLRAGGRFELRLPVDQGCRFDVKVTYRGAPEEERRDQDLCTEPQIVFTGRPLPGSLRSTATGFYVSRDGHIMTNRHTVQGCTQVAIARNGGRVVLERVGEDTTHDLALLREPGATTPVAVFRAAAAPALRPGDRVIVIGYPKREFLGDINITDGIVSGSVGPRGNQSLFQHTAPTQDGNSGSPVFDESGLVVGVVVSRVEERPGQRPAQNVNFAIRPDIARAFAERYGVRVIEAEPGAGRGIPAVFDAVRSMAVPIDCLN